jgi:hypothetical protein
MSVVFDPYHKWLGIPLREQPPNHYRLLGIELFESDAEVISHAADQRMAHLRVFQTGKHGKISQRMLNEVAAVKLCLLNPAKKTVYDAQLRVKLASSPAGTGVSPVLTRCATGAASAGPNAVLAEPVAHAQSVAREEPVPPDDSRQMKLALEVFAAVGVLLIAICVVYNVRQSRSSDSEQIAWHGDSHESQAKPAPSPSESAPVAPVAEKAAPASRPAPSQLVLGGGVLSVGGGAAVPRTIAGSAIAPPERGASHALLATASPAPAAAIAPLNGAVDHAPPPRLGKTTAKKPAGPIYLDDLQELSAGVALGILGKHGDTGYPEFESDYGPKVIFQGKTPEHALSTYPPRKGTGYVSYVLKGEYRTLRAVAAIMQVDPAEAARVAKEPFFMGGPASPLTFRVIGDGKLLWESRPLVKSGDSQVCNVGIEGVSLLELEVACPEMNSYGWAAWIEPALEK